MNRELGRAIAVSVANAASATSAIGRGVIGEVFEDGTAILVLPGGARLRRQVPNGVRVTNGLAVSTTRRGNQVEILEISGWQGGNGAPFPES